jgi:hypothetical protein
VKPCSVDNRTERTSGYELSLINTATKLTVHGVKTRSLFEISNDTTRKFFSRLISWILEILDDRKISYTK